MWHSARVLSGKPLPVLQGPLDLGKLSRNSKHLQYRCTNTRLI